MSDKSMDDINEIIKLDKQFGLPLYVFDEKGFIENYTTFENTMREKYPKYQVSYSYKTNYTPYICKTVQNLGGYAEVVSGMEYYIARKIGYPHNQIIFNGPNKGQDGINAILAGALVNVDNLDELELVCSVAKEFPERQLGIGIRVNLDVGQNFISRFGMDEGDIETAFQRVSAIYNLSIVGLHCHISRCRGIEAWEKRTRYILALCDKYFAMPPKYIDLGSGMFGNMASEFASQFENVPSYSDYAKVTGGLMAEHYKGIEDKPILFTEPGTTLIARYVDFVAKVDAIKTIKGKTFAILNCSEHNLGETCTLKRLPLKVLHVNWGLVYSNVDFVGYTCLEQDVMYTDYTGNLAVGDYVLFGNIGGYSNVYKPPFIWPNCMMIAYAKNGCINIVKQKETYEDLLHTYVFEERLYGNS